MPGKNRPRNSTPGSRPAPKASKKPEPLHSEPALVIAAENEKALVIGDTHIGLENELLESGIRIPSQFDKILARLRAVRNRSGATRLIHLGDLKHGILLPRGQDRHAIESFFEKTLGMFETIDIVPGNHDGGLFRIIEWLKMGKRVSLHGPRGVAMGGIGFAHGHTWPSEEVMSQRLLVLSHLHPAVRLSDALGGGSTEPCWAKGRTVPGHACDFYDKPLPRNQSYIVVPAFNPLCGAALNLRGKGREQGPLFRNGVIEIDNAGIYLLDGSQLGSLSDLRESR